MPGAYAYPTERQPLGHVARHPSGRCSAINRRGAHHPGYVVNRRIRTHIEQAFGCAKDRDRINAMAAYDLVSLAKPLEVQWQEDSARQCAATSVAPA
jgi:hypothetical protein